MPEVQRWKEMNTPHTRERLALAARISINTAMKVLNGQAPGQIGTRHRVALALGIPERILFPAIETRRRTKQSA